MASKLFPQIQQCGKFKEPVAVWVFHLSLFHAYLFLYVKHTLEFGKHEWYWFSKVSSDAVIYSSPSWTDGWAMHDWTLSKRIKFESLKVSANVQLKVEAVNKSGSPDEMWTNFTGSLHLMNLDSPTLRTLATVPKIKKPGIQ